MGAVGGAQVDGLAGRREQLLCGGQQAQQLRAWPQSRRQDRCAETVDCARPTQPTRSVTRASPSASRLRIARRAGSPSDRNRATAAEGSPHEVVAAGSRAVEVDCGSGYGTRLILDRFGAAHVDALDLDPGMVAKARHRLADRPR